jgi:hypothetical protein
MSAQDYDRSRKRPFGYKSILEYQTVGFVPGMFISIQSLRQERTIWISPIKTYLYVASLSRLDDLDQALLNIMDVDYE